jgi:hypothetical protein
MTASWVIVRKITGEAIAETFLRHVAEAVNREAFDVMPIGEWLALINQRTREAA